VDDELQAARERGLDRGLVHFSVALRRMTITDLEQGARGLDRNEQSRPGDQLLVVHIPGVDTGRVRAHSARIARRRHAHAAEEGMQRDLHPRRELRHHAVAVERDDPRAVGTVAVRRQKPTAAVVPVRDREVDLENAHLEHVARVGSFYIDGTGEDVSAGPFVGHLGDDIAQRLLHVGRRDARGLEAVGPIGDERLDLHGVTRGDAQHRRRRGAVIAVGDGPRCGGKPVEMLGCERATGDGEQQDGESGFHVG